MGDRGITVTNFDALLQAQTWVADGPTKSLEQFTAELRTAVLLGRELVLDRNQILDGICFLSLGPEGVARALGLPETADLPLTMTCSPGAGDLGDDVPTDRDPRSWGSVSLDRQLDETSTERYLASSSAMGALTGRRPTSPWMFPSPDEDSWFPGAGLADVFHQPADEEAALALVLAARERWLQAARQARIAVVMWNPMQSLGPALERQTARLAAAAGPDGPSQLAIDVLRQEGPARKSVVDWLNERAAADAGLTDDELRLALTLWTRAYYLAIADKDSLKLLTLESRREPMDAGMRSERLRGFGLVSSARSVAAEPGWSRRAGEGAHSALAVRGEIVDHLKVMPPGTYQRLLRTTPDVVRRWIDGDVRSGNDIALACRRAVDSGPSHRRLFWVAVGRALAVLLLAAAVALLTVLPEVVDLSKRAKILTVTGAAVAGLLAGLPWDQLAEYASLRRGAMRATLDIFEDER